MEYNKLLARSFSHYEQKMIGCWAFGVFLIITILTYYFALISNPSSLASIPILNADPQSRMVVFRDTSNADHDHQVIESAELEVKEIIKEVIEVVDRSGQTKQEIVKLPPVCNVSDQKFDICDINGDIRIDGQSSTILYTSSSTNVFFAGNDSWRIQPYPRKTDKGAMQNVNEILVKSFFNNDSNAPHCTRYHSVPAVIFSVGGFSSNHFHAYNDVLVPLFLTSRRFNQEVQFLITDSIPSWISNIDPLKSPKNYSMEQFTRFLRNAYSLKRSSPISMTVKGSGHRKKHPRLLIVSRRRTRKFSNVASIAKMAKSLGYQVVIEEPSSAKDASTFAQLVNSCAVMMGVHGAGLTNIVFLPPTAVFIQVIPFGVKWVSTKYFAEPAPDMKLQYLEYKIAANESSLIQQYPIDHAVFKDPHSIGKQGWNVFKSVYLDKQDVKLDVERFRPTLLKALDLLRK
ncbi:hypothetical protein C5167_023098 [Papaver somniferum]|uniref:Glycosyltransferase 61 catalytic domain-containing protein n=1 Tax=Papaver somniferum TaxID=3469 RepID=A0A4Y7JNU9_PAPSO|nr:hypothetical protein C5167_023098 [Papaver somniferum]